MASVSRTRLCQKSGRMLRRAKSCCFLTAFTSSGQRTNDPNCLTKRMEPTALHSPHVTKSALAKTNAALI